MNKSERMIFCCACNCDVKARLTNGAEIYPHRPDLAPIPFWKCDTCKNHVGCHYKSAKKTKPLGNIPTPELRNARMHIHRILDPLWKSKGMKRGRVYGRISKALGYEYHTGEIKTLEEAREVFRIVKEMAKA